MNNTKKILFKISLFLAIIMLPIGINGMPLIQNTDQTLIAKSGGKGGGGHHGGGHHGGGHHGGGHHGGGHHHGNWDNNWGYGSGLYFYPYSGYNTYYYDSYYPYYYDNYYPYYNTGSGLYFSW
jgi:uncharacterized membrane protein